MRILIVDLGLATPISDVLLLSAREGSVDTQSDDFVPGFDHESLAETTLRIVGPVTLDNLEGYIRHLRDPGDDPIDASLALLDELDWPYVMNVEGYVWYPHKAVEIELRRSK